ncbi:double-strand break repair helicase AddA [Aurantimonas sp. Leaf443]|uniref:double-strand break repair helicase AddA n=1 Tax=Aurantimonas sp. Leaf443 TaxID=1736378 RepID=UPI00070229B4|nr:double-strand break repair helicase AddA [Aurantimonas sp. Leaf443]KQT83978.1 DNA helicase [Aurantimonas sp. Leaf443]
MSFEVSAFTRERQALASDPARSVFVSANAGSGKTHVLTERVVRLLLSGAEASRILCLTYTKAAAAEMSNRVFSRLARWSTLPAAELAAEIAALEGTAPSPKRLAEARRLFAKALETPGGLKIQTIHAFCEAILHRFALEAGVPGHFQVLDETQGALLLAEARRRLITGAAPGAGERTAAPEAGEEPVPSLDAAFALALEIGGEAGLDELIGEIVARRDGLRRHIEGAGGIGGAIERLRRALDLSPGAEEGLVHAAFETPPGFEPEAVERLALLARASDKPTDARLAERLAELAGAADGRARYRALRTLCLTQKGSPYKLSSLATKAVAAGMPDLADRLEVAVAALAAAEAALSAIGLFRATRAALVVADELERDYADLKRQRGMLDFEDLIVRTADLLSRASASAWVHYKLDQGIDHVLIDEAQDTSPRQWEVMRGLVEEFFTGETARGGIRTVFAVGDEKQSIYSFQGASPTMFADERRAIGQRADAAEARFESVQLTQSFRTASDVLAAVDAVFETPEARRGLTESGAVPTHQTARAGAPGLVEIWPALSAATRPPPDDWLLPVDHQPESAPAHRLARRIADQIAQWLGQPIEHKGRTRPLGPGDVLVLVRKRSAFVEAMAKALRDRAIPIAGADRLILTDHIAVQDLMALGRAVSNFEDDLSLAAVLKSPFFGLSDDELMALALSREPGEHLSLGLRRLAGEEGPARVPDFVADAAAGSLLEKARLALERLEALRRRAGFETVFAFYARLLGPEGGRRALTARLGQDAGEVVDAFLDLALAAEEDGRTGLDGFLADLEAAPPQIKREMDHGRGEVRIMTVHASKGLEAPVVFLVDPGSAAFSASHSARLMPFVGMPGLPPDLAPGYLWRADKSLETATVAALKARESALAEEEYRRLLYVGMTRAADRLVVCGLSGANGTKEGTWLDLVTRALQDSGRSLGEAEGEPLGWRFGKDPEPAASAPPAAGPQAGAPGRVIDLSPLPPEEPAPRPLSPSSAAGAMEVETGPEPAPPGPEGFVSPVLGGDAQPSLAIRRGLVVHRLLQVLPDLAPESREEATRHYAEGAAAQMTPRDRARLVEQALEVLAEPAFAPVFAPGSRAEVSVTGEVTLAGRRYLVSGTIDRLAVSPTRVLIVDYKTNRPPPARLETVPASYIVQLALYREILKPLYPGRAIEAALLFTEAPRLIPVAAHLLDEALARRPALAPAVEDGGDESASA